MKQPKVKVISIFDFYQKLIKYRKNYDSVTLSSFYIKQYFKYQNQSLK